jgi:tetratricopeptide (TPR) repeat protein
MPKARPPRVLFLFAGVLLMGGCSSAPPPSDDVSTMRNQAVGNTASGNSYFQQGRYDLALRFYSQALESNVSIDNLEGTVLSYNDIGNVYMAVAQLDLAETTFRKALGLADGLDPRLTFTSSLNLGKLYLRKADPASAMAAFDLAMAVAEKGVERRDLAVLYHHFAIAWRDLGELEKAEERLAQALEINVAVKAFEQQADNWDMMASIAARKGDYQTAMGRAETALQIDKKRENSLGIAKDLAALGTISLKRKDAAAAFGFFQRSYLVYAALGVPLEIRRVLAELIPLADVLKKGPEGDEYRARLAELEKP